MGAELEKEGAIKAYLEWSNPNDAPFLRMLFDLERDGMASIHKSKLSFTVWIQAGDESIWVAEMEGQDHEQAGRVYFYINRLEENLITKPAAKGLLDALDSTGAFQATSSKYPSNRRTLPGTMPTGGDVEKIRHALAAVAGASRPPGVINDAGEQKLNSSSAHDLLLMKKQVILYGPPGTGKTYSTRDLACDIIENRL